MIVLANIIQDKSSKMKIEYIDETSNTKDEYRLSCTNSYEIRYFEKGSFFYLIEGRSYEIKPNSILFLSRNIFFANKSDKDSDGAYYVISFGEDDISTDYKENILSFFAKDRGVTCYENVRDDLFIDNFMLYKNNDDLSNDLISSFFYYLSGFINKVSYMESYKPETTGNTAVCNIISYVNENLSASLSLDFLVKEFYISKHHLNKVFRKVVGTTVGKYINYKRVVRAQKLIEDGYSASRAAIESGFGDYSAFYRAYIKVLGHTPGGDKKR